MATQPVSPNVTFSTSPSGAKSLASKLAEIMGEIDHVEKRGRNTAQNYSFVRAADVANAVRKKMAEQGIIMLRQIVDKRCYETLTSNGKVQQAIDLHVRYTFRDGTTGETLTQDGYGSGVDSGDKASYKAQTGALKYALRDAFLIPDESDPEAFEDSDPPPQQRGTTTTAAPSMPSAVNTKPSVEVSKPSETKPAAAPAQQQAAAAPPQQPASSESGQKKAEAPATFVARARKYSREILVAGGMQSEKGLGISAKLNKFFIATIGKKDVASFSDAEWENALGVLDAANVGPDGPKKVVTLIEDKIKAAA